MGSENKNTEFIDAKVEQREHKKASLKNVLNGTMLTREIVIKQLPFILFLTVLAVFYIGNRYHAEKLTREIDALQKEIKELRSESITISSDLMYISKESEVIRLLKKNNIDLEESLDPPIVIEMEDD